jgi:hypothetical protein
MNMEEPTRLKPGETEIIKGEYGTYKRYYLSDEDLQKYREIPQDTFWDHNSKPHSTPIRKTKGA